MSHLLVLEVPGGTDFKIVEEAARLGHRVTFFTSELGFYLDLGPDRVRPLGLASAVVQVNPFSYEAFEREVLAIHAQRPFDAILCLIDIRIIEASRIASKLGLPFLESSTASLLRDKFTVRTHLAHRGIRQPRFELATTQDEIAAAIEAIGFPCLVKPADGYGSQNVVRFADRSDLDLVRDQLGECLLTGLDYGFGVFASNRLVVEELIEGTVVGCDTLTVAGRHHFLGINEKAFFPPPSYAIRGSCFPSARFDEETIRAYVLEILDALSFDCGAAHTELVITAEGLPYLVEVNPRLVGAQIPLLVSMALGRSIHEDLINLHLGRSLDDLTDVCRPKVAVSRWLTADREGVLEAIVPPEVSDERIEEIHILKGPGANVYPPFENGHRLGFVMVKADDRAEAERIADAFVAATTVTIRPPSP